jgi:Phytanoyl-CoA dioxygenase (PhyH)
VEFKLRVPDIASTRERFQSDGFVKLDAVLPGAFVDELLDAATDSIRERTAEGGVRGMESGVKPFLQSFNSWADNAVIRRLALSPQLGRLASALLEVESVRLIHDQVLFKEPGDARSPWHIDQCYWPIASAPACSVWVPLHDVPREMGPVACATGSQRYWTEPQRSAEPVDLIEWDHLLAAEIERRGLEVFTADYMAGDIEIHDGRTIHEAGANHSLRPRKAIVLHFMQSSARLREPATPEQEGHVQLFGWTHFAPGQVIRGPVAPRI